MDHRVARFCQVNIDDPRMHHDAPAFPNGTIVLVTRLVARQTATVLGDTPSRRASGRTPSPSALAKITFARSAKPCATVGARRP